MGGRTSAIVPSVQKKTGPVAGDLGDSEGDEREADGDENVAGKAKPRGSKKGVGKAKGEEADKGAEEVEADGDEESVTKSKPRSEKKKGGKNKKQNTNDDEEAEAESKPLKSTKRSIKHEAKYINPRVLNGGNDEVNEGGPLNKKRKADAGRKTEDEVKVQKGPKGEPIPGSPSSKRRRSARVSGHGM